MRMQYIDLRFAVPIVINIAKWSQSGFWDPFNVFLDLYLVLHPTGSTKPWLLGATLLFLTIFNFVSVRLILPCSGNIWRMSLLVGDFSTPVMVSTMASLVLPQTLFWFAFPLILLLSFRAAWIWDVFNNFFFGWVQAVLNVVPMCNITISATLASLHASPTDDQPQPEDQDLEACNNLQQEDLEEATTPQPNDIDREPSSEHWGIIYGHA